MSILKRTGKSLAILALAAMPFTLLGDWLATVRITANTTNGASSDSTDFGVKTNATANYDSLVDKLDPPAMPTGVNTYQELTNSVALSKNCVGPSDVPIFRGEIEYNSIALTSTTATVSGLPNNNFAMLMFSNSAYQGLAGIYNVANDVPINLGINVHSYILTQKPVIDKIGMDNSSKLNLRGRFYCDGQVPALSIEGAMGLDSSFTNYIGQLNFSSGGIYSGTNNSSSNAKFFRLRVSTN